MNYKTVNRLIIICVIFISGCKSNPNNSKSVWQQIKGRESIAIYRACTPSHWTFKETSQNLSDTTQPLCEFNIQDIRITIHNFPSESLIERIPPFAQIERWKRQIDSLDSSSVVLANQSHGGFLGFRFEGENKLEKTVAYIMQLSREHYQTLLRDPNSAQKRADYTIKIVGPKDQVEQEIETINSFARSFELIEEIPTYDDE